MNFSEFAERSRDLALKGRPFLFMVNYEMDDFRLFEPGEAATEGVFYRLRNHHNLDLLPEGMETRKKFVKLVPDPMPFGQYEKAFNLVRKHILHGNSFLLNLTFPTPIHLNLTLEEVFRQSQAPYSLLYKDRFVVFSPESFVRIQGDRIHSFPMKGTIDASIPEARRLIMEDLKEQWEHNTIVDLIRNDLSMVAKEVQVERFRYIEEVSTLQRNLLQVSSHISGIIGNEWRENFPEMIIRLLPAGSICGAPKRKTLEIIREAEGMRRDFFTGIFGYCDHDGLDSGVMIRFMEKSDKGLRFRSGGGITGRSEVRSEYKEMLQKVYVPIL